MPTIALLHAATARHADRLAAGLRTSWTIETATEEDPAERHRDILGRAEVLVASRFDASGPPAPALRLLQTHVTGLDRIAVAALPPGCRLCNVYEHESAVAEYVLAAMLEWCIGLRTLDGRLRRDDWRGGVTMPGDTHRELRGATLGIIGFGRIGREVALRAAPFGMRVIATTRGALAPPPPDVERLVAMDSLDELLAASDFVLVACALTEATRGLIDAGRLARMRPGAVLINVARGAVVDEDDLFAALRDRTIGGAVIDTWYRYPAPGDPSPSPSRHPFATLDNVIMTPHASSWTDEIVARRWAFIARNIDRLARGETPENVVAIGQSAS